jgi:RNA polymerase sporulation-specific sigma factor
MREATDALAVAAAAGDAAAREALVEGVMPLVTGLARRFEGRAAREDLEQAGVVGVLSALPGYDSGHGAGFTAYATPFAVGEMLAVLRGSAPAHVSRTGRDLAATVEAAAAAIAAREGRSPSPGVVAAAPRRPEGPGRGAHRRRMRSPSPPASTRRPW